MTRTIAAVAVLSLTMFTLPAYAQEAAAPTTVTDSAAPGKVAQAISRPAALTALYASYTALQAYDVYSTRQALAGGAREVNPLMRGVVGNTGAFVALKAGVTVATIAVAEKLWKTNKPGAIGLMIAANSVAAFVVARNSRTLEQLR